jgi:hypothetical protein
MDKELRLAFLNKERAELFISNLERLFTDKTVNETSYNILKSEYAANLQHAQLKVDQIKQELNKRLALKTRELEIYKQELANLDARFKVGQLSADEFIKLSKNPDKKINYLEDQISQMNSLISSQHSSEISVQEATGIGLLFPGLAKPAPRPVVVPRPLEPEPPPPPPPVEQPVVIEPPPKPYDPTSISELMILPDRVLPGSTVGVIATIHNPGAEPVQHRTEFKINGRVESINEIMLNPGQSEEMTFMAVAGPPGEYYVSVDNATGVLRVLPSL